MAIDNVTLSSNYDGESIRMNFDEVKALSETFSDNSNIISEKLDEFTKKMADLANSGYIQGAAEQAMSSASSSIQILRNELWSISQGLIKRIEKAHEESMNIEIETANAMEELLSIDPIKFS